MPRDERKETLHGLSTKPSILVDRPGVWRDPHKERANVLFKKEREDIEKKDFDPQKVYPVQEDVTLKNAAERKKEFEEYKENQKKFQEHKTKRKEVNKRDRVAKNGWKNGILGIDNVFEGDTVFFKEHQHEKIHAQFEKDYIQEKRKEGKSNH